MRLGLHRSQAAGVRTALAVLHRPNFVDSGRVLRQLGMTFVEVKVGDRLEWRLIRRIYLAFGGSTLLKEYGTFALVPCRPGLKEQLVRDASAILREKPISGRFGFAAAGITWLKILAVSGAALLVFII